MELCKVEVEVQHRHEVRHGGEPYLAEGFGLQWLWQIGEQMARRIDILQKAHFHWCFGCSRGPRAGRPHRFASAKWLQPGWGDSSNVLEKLNSVLHAGKETQGTAHRQGAWGGRGRLRSAAVRRNAEALGTSATWADGT